MFCTFNPLCSPSHLIALDVDGSERLETEGLVYLKLVSKLFAE